MAERARQSVYIDCNLVQVVIEVCNYANFYYYRVELGAGRRAFVASHKKLKRETHTKGKGEAIRSLLCVKPAIKLVFDAPDAASFVEL